VHAVPFAPKVHLLVCANQRPLDAPLGPGCGAAGQEVYAALKDEVARRRAYQAVWVTQTQCLGICPKRGATVAVYREREPGQIFSEVVLADVPQLFASAGGES
jgi:(2Fe-2S) ferredoxin